MDADQERQPHIPRTAEKFSVAAAVILVVLIGFLSYSDLQQARRNAHAQENAQNLILQVNGLVSSVVDAETGQRGFLLTGKDEYLQPYRRALAEIQPQLRKLRASLAGSPADTRDLDRMEVAIDEKLAELALTIELRKTQGPSAALAIVLNDSGRLQMERIRSAGTQLAADLSAHLNTLLAEARTRALEMRSATVTGSILLLCLVGWSAVLIGRGTSRREELIQAVKEKERETAQSRDFFSTTLSSIGDAVIATDAAGKVTFLNEVAESLTGWTGPEAIGAPVDRIFHIVNETTRERVESPLARAIREGVTVTLANHTLLQSRAGELTPIDDSAAPLRDAAGTICGAVLVFRDISPRRQNELALEKSGKRFREAFASAPIGMVLTDTEGRFIDSNEAYCQITGYEPSELPSKDFLSLTHPDDILRNRELFEQLLSGAVRSYVLEKRVLPKSGPPLWVRAGATILAGPHGEFPQVVGIVENIDDRKKAESLLAVQARLNALDADIGKALSQAETLPASLHLCAEAMVRHLDAAFARIWTMNDARDTLELQASAGLYTHLNGAHACIPVGAFKIGRIAQQRRPHLTNDVLNDEAVGDRAWARDNGMVGFAGYPLMIGRRVVGVVGMFARHALPAGTLDALSSAADSIAIGIERKHNEARLLDSLVRERNAKAEIEINAKALLRSNEDLEHFVNAASHDLRSPLRTVNLMTTMLARRYKGQLDEKADELIRSITGGASRMDSLLSDLLAFCTTTHAERVTEPVAMKESAEEAVANLHAAIAESKAAITIDELPMVMAHKTHLLQLFQNLIGNSIKYRSDVPPVVNVSALRQDKQWLVKVTDNGTGFDPRYAQDVFTAFKRLHGNSHPGSGIGLATCKRIVEGYGGSIWAQSAVGQGSTFCFTLPADV